MGVMRPDEPTTERLHAVVVLDDAAMWQPVVTRMQAAAASAASSSRRPLSMGINSTGTLHMLSRVTPQAPRPPPNVTKAERDVGKTINFATIYGQGATALSQQLKIERKEAQRRIDAYFELYSGVARYVRDAVVLAEEQGYAETLLGRRRIIPELSSKSPMDRGFGERVAVNTPIQGGAADICKLAMLRLHTRLAREVPRARLLLQIHDELVIECHSEDADAVASICRTEMERRDIGDVTLKVPLVAEVGIGASWGDAK
jgi:DNA polymerase-1